MFAIVMVVALRCGSGRGDVDGGGSGSIGSGHSGTGIHENRLRN